MRRPATRRAPAPLPSHLARWPPPTPPQGSVRLLLALRADFMGRAMDGPTAPFIAPARQCQVGPLDTAELKAAILGPAAAWGVRFGPGLVDAMVADLEDQPGRLPLLQFALTQLWDQQQARCIDAAALERLGGVRRALSAYADGVINALSEADRTRARRILIQLVRPAERAADVGTRQVASLRRIADQDQDLLPRLAASRLVVTSGGTDAELQAEIAHEALIREWDRLRTWVGEDRVFRLWQEGLRSRLADWETRGRHPGYLLAGTPLAEAEGRLAVYPEGLSQADRAYIRESRGHAERGRRRGRAAVVAVILGLAAVAGVAGWQWQRAAAEARRAEMALSSAEDLVSFMTFELHEKLQPIGRLELLRDTQTRIDRYYAQQGEPSGGPVAMRRRAVNLSNSGDLASALGDLSGGDCRASGRERPEQRAVAERCRCLALDAERSRTCRTGPGPGLSAARTDDSGGVGSGGEAARQSGWLGGHAAGTAADPWRWC